MIQPILVPCVGQILEEKGDCGERPQMASWDTHGDSGIADSGVACERLAREGFPVA